MEEFRQEFAREFRQSGGPTRLAGRMMEWAFHQGSSVPLADTQAVYMALCQDMAGLDVQQARNSWVSASGGSLQRFVVNHINDRLASKGILASTEQSLHRLPVPDFERVTEFLSLPARRRCQQSPLGLWPDTDVIVLTMNSQGPWQVIAIISCKTSLRERWQESTFWALATRDLGIKYAFVTEDPELELGTCERPRRARRALEAYMDRTYSMNPRTSMCSQILPLFVDGASALCNDLERWREDIVTDAYKAPISSELIDPS
ncbi:MAG: hypothetical protein HYX89_04610 [Chloroflexi bacterium]|nr:hypothetical protein [Chloroflexota bacterium]